MFVVTVGQGNSPLWPCLISSIDELNGHQLPICGCTSCNKLHANTFIATDQGLLISQGRWLKRGGLSAVDRASPKAKMASGGEDFGTAA